MGNIPRIQGKLTEGSRSIPVGPALIGSRTEIHDVPLSLLLSLSPPFNIISKVT